MSAVARLWLASASLLLLARHCATSHVDRLPSLIRQASDSFPPCLDEDGQLATDIFNTDVGDDDSLCATFCYKDNCPVSANWLLEQYEQNNFPTDPALYENYAHSWCIGDLGCSSTRICDDKLTSAVAVYSGFTADSDTSDLDNTGVPVCKNARIEKTASACYLAISVSDSGEFKIETGERKIEIDDSGLITEGSCPGRGGASAALKGVGITAGVVSVAALAGIAVWFKLKGVPAALTLAKPSGLKPGMQGKPDVEAPMPPPSQACELSKVGDADIARQLGEVARAIQDPKGNPDAQESGTKAEDLPGAPPELPKGFPMHLVIALDTSVRGCSRNGLVGDSRAAYSNAICNLLKALSVLAIGDVEVSLVSYAGDAAEMILFSDGSLGATDLDSVSTAIKAANSPRGAAVESSRATALASMQAVDLGLKILFDGEKNNPNRRRGRILLFNGGGVSENEMTQARQNFSGSSGRQSWVSSHGVVVAGVGPFTSADTSGIDRKAAAQLGCVAVFGKNVEQFGVGDHARVIKRIFHERQNPNGFRGPTFNTAFTARDVRRE